LFKNGFSAAGNKAVRSQMLEILMISVAAYQLRSKLYQPFLKKKKRIIIYKNKHNFTDLSSKHCMPATVILPTLSLQLLGSLYALQAYGYLDTPKIRPMSTFIYLMCIKNDINSFFSLTLK